MEPIQKQPSGELTHEQAKSIYRAVIVEGRPLGQIAATHGVSEESAMATIQRYLERHVPLALELHDTRVRRLHLARLEHQWREAMNAWYRSIQREEIVKVSSEGHDADANSTAKDEGAAARRGSKRKIERTTLNPCGDVRYLEQARRILAEYRELCDGHTPAEHEEWIDVEALTTEQREEELDRILAALDGPDNAAPHSGTDQRPESDQAGSAED